MTQLLEELFSEPIYGDDLLADVMVQNTKAAKIHNFMKTTLVECVSTGCRLPECVAREVDDLFRTLPTGCTYQTKAVAAEYQFEPGERSEVSILTAATVDKTNEVVLPSGVDLEPYRKSMVVLWNHDQERPVAKCAWVKLQNDTIRAKTVYPEDGPEFTGEVWSMTKSGILKAKSIGFMPRKPLRDPTTDELEQHPEWKGAGVWEDVLLLEYSCCSIGMNHDALVEAVNTKSVSGAVLKSLGFDLPEPQIKSEPTPVEVKAPCKCHKYTDAQMRALEFLAKPKPPEQKAAPRVDMNKLLAEIIHGIDLNADRIVARALDQYRSRGKV